MEQDTHTTPRGVIKEILRREKFYLGVIIKVSQRKESFIKFPSCEEDSRCRHPGNCQPLLAGFRMYVVGWIVLSLGVFVVSIRTYS